MLLLPVVIVLFAMFTLGPGPDRRHGEHVLSRLRPSGLGDLAGLVLRDADPLSDEAFPDSAQWLFWLNPAYSFIELFQDIIVRGTGPAYLWSAAAVIAAASLGVGYAIFKSHEDKMVFRL